MIYFSIKKGAKRPVSYIIDKIEVVKEIEENEEDKKLIEDLKVKKIQPEPLEPDPSNFIFQKDSLKDFRKLLKDKKPITIIAFGDSITAGAGLWRNHSPNEEKYTYHYFLREMLEKEYSNKNIKMINAGIGGEKAVDGLKRVDKDVLSKKPDLVIVEFGGNDTELEVYKDAIIRIVDILLAKKIFIILVTPPKFVGSEDTKGDFVSFLKDFSKSRNIALVDYNGLFLSKGEEFIGELVGDEVHPNERGHLLFAKGLFKLLN
jgi:lysophospholipase L1-like esterase